MVQFSFIYLHLSSYLVGISKMLLLIFNIIIPRVKNIAPNNKNKIVVLIYVGTGLHAGNVCCLKFELFNFSNLSLIFYFSSSVISILLLIS